MEPLPEMSQSPDEVNVGNPQDIQGILALIIIGAILVVSAIALLKGADPLMVLDKLLLLGAVVVGFYYGVKSQQS